MLVIGIFDHFIDLVVKVLFKQGIYLNREIIQIFHFFGVKLFALDIRVDRSLSSYWSQSNVTFWRKVCNHRQAIVKFLLFHFLLFSTKESIQSVSGEYFGSYLWNDSVRHVEGTLLTAMDLHCSGS